MAIPQTYPEKEYRQSSAKILSYDNAVTCLIILILTSGVAFILQPRIGVRDEDAYSYIVGAYSIQAGNGYTDLSGGPLNHYPPGYSLILSIFPSPLLAALFLNYLSFGAAIVLIYYLAKSIGNWPDWAALGLALAVGFIFLRRHATNAAPDILTYALFLLSFLFHNKGGFRLRIISYLIWSALIPIKLIAVIFVPAAVLASYLGRPLRIIWAERFELVMAVANWVLFLSITMAYNFLTIKTALPQSHIRPNPNSNYFDITRAVSQYLVSIPRTFLSNWYGSLGSVSALTLFIIVLLVSLACLLTLRPHSGQIARHAILLTLLTILLQFGSRQVNGARMAGYGLITLFFAFRPVWRWGKIWMIYGLLGLSLSVFNACTQNSLGANDPRYEKLAHEAAKIESFPRNVSTNSFHILDLHAKIATQYIRSPEALGGMEYFFWVSLPQYDAIATTVSPVAMPGEEWDEVATLTGAKLFCKRPQKKDIYEK